MTDEPEVGPLVTVVVPTKNVARTLEACLRSVRAQDWPRLELIVIDNFSTDATAEIAARYAHQLLVAGPERSVQRNLGVEQSNGEYVLWIDSDMILPPRTVSAAVAEAQRTSADAVSIPEVSVGPGFWTACRALERSCYLDDPALYYPRLIRREFLLGLGGFTESMAGPEDVDLRLRMNANHAVLAHSDSVHILHDEGRLTLRSILAKRVYYGKSLPAFAAAHPGALAEQGKGTVAAFRRHRRRVAKHPVLAAGIVLMRGSEAAAYGVGYAQGKQALRRRPNR
jgi:glycosyltransferase involved in cell wall biosynthesis